MNLRHISILSMLFFVGCSSHTKSQTDQAAAKGFSGLGSGSRKQTITLRNGHVIDVNSYRASEEALKTIEANRLFRIYSGTWTDGDISVTESKLKKKWESSLANSKSTQLLASELFGIFEYSISAFLATRDYFDPAIKDADLKEGVEYVEAIILSAISGLNKLPKHQGAVYFGACLDKKIFLPLLKPGKIFSQSNFTSTSTDPKIAGLFAGGCASTEAGVRFSVAHSISGRKIVGLSTVPTEEEVLFLPAQAFRVAAFKRGVPSSIDLESPEYDIYDVELEELP